MKQHSGACERNQQPILQVLRQVFASAQRVLEIGSGTGQHAVYFAPQLPHLAWQTSDLEHNHPSIQAWINDSPSPNLLPPLVLDMAAARWPTDPFDAAFTANTCHIMNWVEVEAMFDGVGNLLPANGVFAVYGPFNYDGKFTSDSNARFDASLREFAPHMGIRDMGDLQRLARQHGLQLEQDIDMPANNRILVWRKVAP
ncbi:MAG: hypothetical protein RL748_2002 [Pseudomonadota bacterium]